MQSVFFSGESVVPSKIVCVGRNYVAHAQELGNEVPSSPVLFLKPNSALSAGIHLRGSDAIHYEGELSFLIRSGRPVGVGIGLDLTKRQLQSQLKQKGLPWERAKAFDGSAVFTSFVPFAGDFSALQMELYKNSDLLQVARCALMIFSPLTLIADIQEFMTLEDNDIVMTGTPEGVGKINVGDHFQVRLLHQATPILEEQWTAEGMAKQ